MYACLVRCCPGHSLVRAEHISSSMIMDSHCKHSTTLPYMSVLSFWKIYGARWNYMNGVTSTVGPCCMYTRSCTALHMHTRLDRVMLGMQWFLVRREG